VVTASWDRTARLWDVDTQRQVGVLTGHSDAVKSAAFSSDGRRVVTTSDDKTARIWDADSYQQIAVLPEHQGQVRSGAFSPDGGRIVTSSNSTIWIWRVFRTTSELLDHGKRIVPRCLARGRREQAFLDPEPPFWCIEMEKWPYNTGDWKDWLRYRRASIAAPLPETAEWKQWRRGRESDQPN